MEQEFSINTLITELKFQKVIGRSSDPKVGKILCQSKSAFLVFYQSPNFNISFYALFSRTSVEHWKIAVLRNRYEESVFFTKYFRSARICAEWVRDNLVK